MPNHILEAKQALFIKELIAEKNSQHDEQLIHDMIEGETHFYEALESVLNEISENESLVAAVSIRQKELAERKSRLQAKSEKLRELIMEMMVIVDEKKAVLPEATISLSNQRPKVLITDESKIPDEFIKIERKVDKTAIANALKEKSHVEGALLSNGGQTITIRRK